MPVAERWLGTPSAPGRAVGPAHVVRSRQRRVAQRTVMGEAKRQAEVARLQHAVDTVDAGLRQSESLLMAGGITDAGDLVQALVASHHAVLTDPLFIGAALARVRDEGLLAEWALERTLDDLRSRFATLTRPEFRGWFRDVEGLCGELMAQLIGQSPWRYLECDRGDIVVAGALTISDVITLIQRGAAGIVLETDSLTSHVAVLCRSAGLPAATGLDGVCREIATDQLIALDGDSGEVELLSHGARQPEATFPADATTPPTRRGSPAMRLHANLDLRLDAEWARSHGTTGVGLWRTFFLYLGRPDLPTEDELTATFSAVLADFAPETVAIRLVDLSGPFEDEELPAALRGLGECRGIRLRLERPGLLETQIRALVRAAPAGNLRILVPFVTEPMELAWVREKVAEAQRQLGITTAIQIGAMVEVPALLFMLDELVAQADFLAIGSNDLNALLLAKRRDGPSRGPAPRLPHAALLRAITGVVQAGARAGIDVSLCGELASDPAATEALFQTGLRELSLAPRLAAPVYRAMDALGGDGR